MNPLARYKPSQNSDLGCTDLMTMAERELSAFFNAVTEVFGAEQAKISAKDWLQELIETGDPPTSAREWRLITAKVSTRLPSGANASSRSSSLSANS
jgi:hypothetical protein